MDLATFTAIHTALSLIAMAAGLVVVIGLLRNRTMPWWTALFLLTAVATSATGFGFPFNGFLPSHAVGIVSLIVLAAAILARYLFRFAGAWQWIYVAGIVVGLYLDVFVGVVQAFQKIPALHALAPTQTEPAFAYAQIGTLIVFIVLGIASMLTFDRRSAVADA